MRAKAEGLEINPRMLTLKQGCSYTGMGTTNFTKWARAIGSERKFGRSTRFDRKIIDKALDQMEPAER